MMKATNISKGAAKSGYYNVEGYYTRESDEAADASTWYGTAAKELGLEGKLDPQVFEKMLDGQTYEKGPEGLVEGKLSGKWVDGERQHRPGLDLTFSAPKAVSLAGLLFEDNRVVEAHQNAVKAALDMVETELLQTRRQVDGEMVKEGGKMIAGLFVHDTSRSLDPQLHTHAAIANMVKNMSGEFTALNNDQIMKSVTFGSAVYRKVLADELEKLGYTVEREGPHGLISLKEIPKAFEELYSKRSKQIEEAIEKYGAENTPKNRELAALATRVRKEDGVDRDLLRDEWKKEAQQAGLDFEKVAQTVSQVRERKVPVVETRFGQHVGSDLAREAINKGIAHLSETSTTFSKPAVLEAALTLADERVPAKSVFTELNKAVEDKRLLPAADHSRMGKSNIEMYTDENSLLTERQILSAFQKGQNASRIPRSFKGRAMSGAISQKLRFTSLSEGQKEAIHTSLTGSSLFTGVQGYAGTGKTYMLERLEKIANKSGFHVAGLAPSHQATGLLKEAINDSETLQAFLTRGGAAKNSPSPKKTILVIDEASFTSNKQMLALMKLATEQKYARVVLVGDAKQLDGVEAGTPFSLLQKMKMPTATMIDIVRQRDDNLKSAVYHAIAGEVQDAFKKIGSNIHIAPDRDYAREAAELFLSKGKVERDNTIIATPSNQVRSMINEHVRVGLKENGELAQDGQKVETLLTQRMSRIQLQEPRSYRAGDIVLSRRTIDTANLVEGREYVVQLDKDKGLQLTDRLTGKTKPFDPTSSHVANAVTVFTKEEKEFVAGERIKFSIPDNGNEIRNGDKGTIVQVDDRTTTIQLDDTRTLKLNNTDVAVKGMDYAYSLTGHGVQGASVDNIIVALGANEYLADQKGFYVGISRGKDNAALVTDDVSRLAERLERQTGEQISALEAYGRKLDENQRAENERAERDEQIASKKEEHDKSTNVEKTLSPEPIVPENSEPAKMLAPDVEAQTPDKEIGKNQTQTVELPGEKQTKTMTDLEDLRQKVQELGEQKQRGEIER